MSRFAKFVAAASIAVFATSAQRQAAAQPQPYPFGWDTTLWSAPRPSPLPVGFNSPKDFHRHMARLPEGGLGLEFVDVLLPNGAVPLTIQRRYRSTLRSQGSFGIGWSSNLDVRLQFATDGTPQVRLWYLPPYSPDLNPIEQAFAKIKHWMRTAQKRTAEDVWRHLGGLVATISPTECSNCFANAGYASAKM